MSRFQTPVKHPGHDARVLQDLDVDRALRCGELSVTLSELLGCDYVFIHHPAKTLIMHDRHLADTLTNLVQSLGLPPTQKIFIGLYRDTQDDLRFYRLVCEWQGKKALRVERMAITDDEQWEFTRMMYECSSPHSPLQVK